MPLGMPLRIAGFDSSELSSADIPAAEPPPSEG